jgi:preprotein translocase subunit YajC
MKGNNIMGLVIYFAMIYGIFYFASKGWTAGE